MVAQHFLSCSTIGHIAILKVFVLFTVTRYLYSAHHFPILRHNLYKWDKLNYYATYLTTRA